MEVGWVPHTLNPEKHLSSRHEPKNKVKSKLRSQTLFCYSSSHLKLTARGHFLTSCPLDDLYCCNYCWPNNWWHLGKPQCEFFSSQESKELLRSPKKITTNQLFALNFSKWFVEPFQMRSFHTASLLTISILGKVLLKVLYVLAFRENRDRESHFKMNVEWIGSFKR